MTERDGPWRSPPVRGRLPHETGQRLEAQGTQSVTKAEYRIQRSPTPSPTMRMHPKWVRLFGSLDCSSVMKLPPRVSIVRRARHGAGMLALVLTALVATTMEAEAGDRQGRGGRPPMLRGGGFGPRMMRAGPPGRPAREQAPVQAAPAERAAEAPPQPQGRPGRLTPDERRALRQQINDAGRDIYRAPAPR
jgi:hypothetical protein